MEEKAKKPKSKARKIIEWIGTAIIGVVFAFIAVCNVAKLLTRNEYGQGNAFGFGTYVVLTDSMEPVYNVGSAIITYKEDPKTICEEFDKIKDLNLDKTHPKNINLTFVDAYTGGHKDTGIPGIYDQTTPLGPEMIMTHQLFKYEINPDIEEGKGRYTFFVHGINVSEHQSKEGQYQVFTEKELLGVVKTNSKLIGGISKFLTSVWGLLICLLIPALYLIVTSVIDLFKASKMEEEEASAISDSPNSNSIDNLSDKEYEELKQQMIDEMINGKGDKK